MVSNRMKKIDAHEFVEMLQEDLTHFEESVSTYMNRNSREWWKLLNDWVEYGFSRRATEEWEEYEEEVEDDLN